MRPFKSSINLNLAIGLLLLIGSLVAVKAEVSVTDRFSLSGFAWATAGKFEHAYLDSFNMDTDFDGMMTEDVHAGLSIKHLFEDSLLLKISIGAFYQQSLTLYVADNVKVGNLLKMYLVEASVSKTLQNSLFLKAGFFSAKYNENSKNLGEYLFRSGAYPPFLVSGFELADKHKFFGVMAQKTFFGEKFVNQLYVGSELTMYPFYDLSFAYLPKFSIPWLSLGVGIMGSRIVSVNEKHTTPATDPKNYNPELHLNDLHAVYDSSSKSYENLTFSAWKGCTYLSFGPKEWGVYAEAAVLGFKNYPVWYTNVNERIPIMAGYRSPKHPLAAWGTIGGLSMFGLLQKTTDLGDKGVSKKIIVPSSQQAVATWASIGLLSWVGEKFFEVNTRLDDLRFEVEYYGSPYLNSPQNILNNRSPAPYDLTPQSRIESLNKFHQDDWKWSLYASKNITDYSSVSAQVSNDNLSRGRYGAPKDYPITVNPRDWYWMVRAKVFF